MLRIVIAFSFGILFGLLGVYAGVGASMMAAAVLPEDIHTIVQPILVIVMYLGTLRTLRLYLTHVLPRLVRTRR